MQSPLIPLESLQIASPCRADWDAMQGNDCVRFCPSCGKNVYNLSAMTREEAERLIARKEGMPCVRMRRRSDGTVITEDCPVGSATRKRQRWGVQLLAGVLGWVGVLLGWRSVMASHSADVQQPSITEDITGIAGPTSEVSVPNVSLPNTSVPNVLGIDAPSSITTSGGDGTTGVTMGLPMAPTPTLVPDDTIKEGDIKSQPTK